MRPVRAAPISGKSAKLARAAGQIFNLASQGYVTIRHLFGYRGRLNRHDYETFSAVVTACSASFTTSESFELENGGDPGVSRARCTTSRGLGRVRMPSAKAALLYR